jgi:hypothetical protein
MFKFKGEKKTRPKLSSKDYEKLGRSLESVVESGYINKWRLYRMSFTRGIFVGLGTVLGGTILVAFILWILTIFTEIPFLGDVADKIRQSVTEGY